MLSAMACFCKRLPFPFIIYNDINSNSRLKCKNNYNFSSCYLPLLIVLNSDPDYLSVRITVNLALVFGLFKTKATPPMSSHLFRGIESNKTLQGEKKRKFETQILESKLGTC